MLLWFRCWDLEIAPMYVKKYMLGWLVFDNQNIYWSGACSYLVSISLSSRWLRKKLFGYCEASVVQHKNIGRGLFSCKASLVIRTDTSKSCYSIARLGKQRYFISIQTFAVALIHFGFRRQRKWSPFGYLYFYFGVFMITLIGNCVLRWTFIMWKR